ncbi:chromosomal replication initiator protein [Palleronia aestuarii]|uniref:Chromosomal replication initiator protein DnaA n=1 Tax=Palleronia aestuarii TaxID=568105 RepID=A0A2W7N4P8_9RHOB|nr:chromosomal replication initiator protein DnaA [Palleronia aestuarii]PZX15051.1 chromosomal replication initiator protein [Palleronia aestuarii]
MTRDSWRAAQQRLKLKVGHNNFVTWIEPLEFADLRDGILTFRVHSSFMGDWVERYYGDHILTEVTSGGATVRRLAFVVDRGAAANDTAPADVVPPPARAAVSETAPDAQREPLGGCDLDEFCTFDTFVVGKPNELAHAAARRVAEGMAIAFNPLFLYGGTGLGKTHLMHAIAWELQAREPDARVLYLSAEQFMYRFIQALRDRQMIDFKHLFRSVDVLMVDDVQFIAGKDSTQEEFFHTFNALVEQKKQIIISADCAPGEIQGLESRIVSRLNSGLVVDVHPTSYELRLGILQRKVEVYAPIYGDVVIGDGVLELLAHRVTKNVREMEGALKRLYAFGSLIGREVDLAAAEECLRDILRINDRKTTIDQIQRSTADHYNIRLSELLGPRRSRVFARPRQVAMYLAKEMTDRSLPEIARRFGNRDHTTIMHGIKRIEELRLSDPQIAEDIDMLRRSLRPI